MADKYISGEEYQAMSQKKPTKAGHEVSLSVHTIGAIVIVVLLCIVSFLGGSIYGKHIAPKTTVTSASSSAGAGGGSAGREGFRNGGGFGQVTAVSSSSITLQNPRSGTSTTYSITSSTTITDNGQTVAASSIQTGDTVIIEVASSGSTVAKTILVNPNFGGGGGGASSNGSSTGGAAGSSTTGGSDTEGQ
jgi:hypothetical protein